AGLGLVGGQVDRLAVDRDATVRHQLARGRPGHREAHAVDDVVEAGLEQLQQVLTRVALLGRGLLVVVAELALQQAVDALDLLLLAQLDGVVGELAATRAGAGAVLAGLLLQLALRVEGAGGRLQREVGAFAAGELAGGTDITSHFLSPPLDATLLRRTAPVVRDRRHVDDVGDLVAHIVERTDGRLAAGARALDADFKRLHAVVEGGLASLLCGDLGSERGGLARTAETRAARSRPRQRIALAVGDGDDGVVERSVDVGDAVGDDALDLLLRLGCRLGHDLVSLFPDGLARTLAGACIGPGALAAQREATAMAEAAVAGQVHQALDRHADLAAEVALDHELADFGAEALDFGFGQVA